MKPRVYIACLAAYNAGILHGEWVDAAQEPDEIQAAINEMLKASPIPNAEEWAVHDSEDMGNIGEFINAEEIAKRAAFIAEHGEAAIVYLDGNFDDTEIGKFEDRYIGEFETIEEYAEQLVEESEVLEKMNDLRHYFDYESYTRDLAIKLYTEQSNGKVYIFDPAV